MGRGHVGVEEQAVEGNGPKWRPVVRQVSKRGARKGNHRMVTVVFQETEVCKVNVINTVITVFMTLTLHKNEISTKAYEHETWILHSLNLHFSLFCMYFHWSYKSFD